MRKNSCFPIFTHLIVHQSHKLWLHQLLGTFHFTYRYLSITLTQSHTPKIDLTRMAVGSCFFQRKFSFKKQVKIFNFIHVTHALKHANFLFSFVYKEKSNKITLKYGFSAGKRRRPRRANNTPIHSGHFDFSVTWLDWMTEHWTFDDDERIFSQSLACTHTKTVAS